MVKTVLIFDKEKNACSAVIFKDVDLEPIDYRPRSVETNLKDGFLYPTKNLIMSANVSFNFKHENITSMSCNKKKYIKDIIKTLKEEIDK